MTKRLIALLLVITTMLSLMGSAAPVMIGDGAAVEAVADAPVAEVTYDYSADVGKHAVFTDGMGEYTFEVLDEEPYAGADYFNYAVFDFSTDIVFEITDWKVVTEYADAAMQQSEGTEYKTLDTLWYRVNMFNGSSTDDSFQNGWWIMQNYVSQGDAGLLDTLRLYPVCPVCKEENCGKTHVYCDVCNKYDCEADHALCPICGKDGCGTDHSLCPVCGVGECGLIHLYCNVCQRYDCEQTHAYCGTCGKYDCGADHKAEYRPETAPTIPDYTLPEGVDFAVVDGKGSEIGEGGIVLPAGKQMSLSAWTHMENAAYKWQVRYDHAKDLWTDIQGENERGILFSAAMLMSAADESGKAYLRFVATDGTEELTSAAIPVTLQGVGTAAASSSDSDAAEQAEDVPELTKNYVVVQYLYADGRTASAADFSSIIPGQSYAHSYELPQIPGYKAVLKTHSFGDSVKISGNALEMNIAAEALTEEYTIFTVEYQPDYVNYTVIHYQQNVDNDNYTEFERETIGTTHKTGEMITDVHNQYPGFYHLPYETPVAAADGSTVIEVYYDRNYYLMTFELGQGGYGMKPIYARFGAAVKMDKVTRPGFVAAGWTDADGNDTSIPNTVPVGGGHYIAKWTEADTNYTVSYWIVNDDGTRSLIGTHISSAVSGESVSGEDDLKTDEGYICNEESSHSHSDDCYSCNQAAHTHTAACFAGFNLGNPEGYDPNGIAAIEAAGGEEGYIYVIYNPASGTYWPKLYLNRNRYVVNGIQGGTTEDSYSSVVTGEKLLEKTVTYGTETLTVMKYQPNTSCGSLQHDHASCGMTCRQHVHEAKCYFAERAYLEYVDSATVQGNTYTTDKNVEVKGDGTTVVNVYYQYKQYTLKFYYAASEGSGNNITYKIVGGTTYYFGSGGKDTTDDETLLQNHYFDYSGQWGGVDELPTLNDRGNDRNYTTGSVTYTRKNRAITYYYISFTARYGDNIYDKWPCAVFNSVTRTDKDNANGWSGTEAFVSAWNGEYYVQYSQENANQTIKGIYEKLDENLLFVPEYKEDYDEVSFLCFWENGANIDWSVPELYRYNIYLEADSGQDLSGKTTVVRDGITYYLSDSYDTCDNSTVDEQTQVSLIGHTAVTFNTAQNGYEISPSNKFEYRKLTGTTDAALLEQGGYFDSRLYQEGYEINFYYGSDRHNLVFWNHDDFLMDGDGSKVAYGASLLKYFEGVTVNGVEYEGANDIVIKPEKYPKTLEPGAYEFEGWYTSPTFQAETKVDPATATMPNGTLRVYARWVPVVRTVRFYIDENASQTIDVQLGAGYEKFGAQQIAHGTELVSADGSFDPTAIENDTTHPYLGYDFVGWFYKENGEEKAFLTGAGGTPVTKDLKLYAKWSSSKICQYNIYFALDADGDGAADTDANGNVIYIADPVSGSGIAGRTYTFYAKGGQELYDPDGDVTYREGYFPTVDSHSIVVDIQDEQGVGKNSFTFLYRERTAVPYTVRYINKETGTNVFTDADNNQVTVADKVVADNKNVVVTEDYAYIQGYIPDAYQMTLVVTAEGENVITFYYTKDIKHSLYVVNYYIQELDEDLNHKGWAPYHDPLQNTGDIGKTYSAEAIAIDGFTLSKDYTDLYNITEGKNAYDGDALATLVGSLTTADGKSTISGTLTDKVMELNFYYTRNLYPYEFRYMLNGTTTKLADSEFGMAGYDTVVTMPAKNIEMDLDGDGINEDYKLYDAAESTKDIHIKMDGDPLTADDAVAEGQAKVNVATFYYVRCTQTMTITKTVVDSSAVSDPDPDAQFQISLQIHAKNGYHRSAYSYVKSDGTKGTLSPEISAPTILQFTLKHGETITIEGLPTAEYTVSEANLPAGYYDTYVPGATNKLTVNGQLDVTVTNTFAPASLELSKTVTVIEGDLNDVANEEFRFFIAVPEGVSGTYHYTVGGETKSAAVEDGKLTVTLKHGQTAAFMNLPEGSYTVTEEDRSAEGYDSNYCVNNAADYTEGETVKVDLARNTTQTVAFMNKFPVGDLAIHKVVTKEYFGAEWKGDTFTFTVERNSDAKGQAKTLDNGLQYKVLLDGSEQTAQVKTVSENKLLVTITFTEAEGAALTAEDDFAEHTLTIKNLPAGTYTVTETANERFTTAPAYVIGGLAAPSQTPNQVTEAKFENELKRLQGDLYLEKLLEKADGYVGELPDGTEFDFTVELLEVVPTESKTLAVSYSHEQYTDGNPAATSVTMVNGKFTVTLEKDWNVTVSGLPEGNYRIIEKTIPSYANSFAHKINDSWVTQPRVSTDDGNMYTDIKVDGNGRAEVQCTNVYPVNVADLTITNTVLDLYDANDSFVFTVTGPEGYCQKIVIKGSGSVTIEDLLIGEYTVTPDGEWSWRYTMDAPQTKTLAANGENTFPFTPERSTSKWLSGSDYVRNLFNQTN